MGYVSCTTGMNCSIFGYMSSGEIVPDVMTTLLKRSNTGLIAREGSRQLWRGWGQNQLMYAKTYVKWNIGFGTVALSVSKGSRISRKPDQIHEWYIKRCCWTTCPFHMLKPTLRNLPPSGGPSIRPGDWAPMSELMIANARRKTYSNIRFFSMYPDSQTNLPQRSPFYICNVLEMLEEW
jgi:hypothetical protein